MMMTSNERLFEAFRGFAEARPYFRHLCRHLALLWQRLETPSEAAEQQDIVMPPGFAVTKKVDILIGFYNHMCNI